MAYDPMYDDDEARAAMLTGQYPAPRAPSPLASTVPSPAVPRAPLNFAASLLPAYKPYFDAEAAKNAALKTEVYDPQRKRLEDYTKDLQARRAGPTSAERLYDIGAALMRPTATPGFGGMIANIAPVLAGQRKARREAEDAQRELALKYDLEIGNIGDEEAKGRISGLSALMKSIMAAQLKAGKGTPMARILFSPTTGIPAHPYLGTPLKAADQTQVDWLLSAQNNPDPQVRQRAMAIFDKQIGMGAAKQYIDYFTESGSGATLDADTGE